MKNHHYMALAALAVLLVGTVVLLPTGRGENESQASGESSRSPLPMKSMRRSDALRQSQSVLPLVAGEARRRQAERLAAGRLGNFGRTFLLPVREQEMTTGSQVTQVPTAASAVGIKVPLNQGQEGTARSTVLAAQVVSHRRGRVEFMKKRTEELSSHTPGCTCAHHLGKK